MGTFKFSYKDAVAEGKGRIRRKKQTPEHVANILTLIYGLTSKQRLQLQAELEAYVASLHITDETEI